MASLGGDAEKVAAPDAMAAVHERLAAYEARLEVMTKHHLGYPYNLRFESERLTTFMKYAINNLGDPFVASNYRVDSREFELDVLRWFAEVFEAKEGEYWGYTTACGTEGNLLGMIYAREALPDAVVYCSKETHYSIGKAALMYRMEIVFVDSKWSGQMNYSKLADALREHPGRPAIVICNAGTTVKGAVDCFDRIVGTLADVGLSREQFYIHVDGALNGLVTEFADGASDKFKISFARGVDSVSISGHKLLGCPMPCGVVLTRKEHSERFSRDIEYLNSSDTTILGSRNGHAAIHLYYNLMQKGRAGLTRDVKTCRDNAEYLRARLADLNISVLLNKFSITVCLERPPEHIVLKYQLACVGTIAHVVCMPSVTTEILDQFIDEVVDARRGATAQCVAPHMGPVRCRCDACKDVVKGGAHPHPVPSSEGP